MAQVRDSGGDRLFTGLSPTHRKVAAWSATVLLALGVAAFIVWVVVVLRANDGSSARAQAEARRMVLAPAAMTQSRPGPSGPYAVASPSGAPGRFQPLAPTQ